MDGYTQDEMDQQMAYEQRFDEAWEFAIAEGMSDQEAEMYAERAADAYIMRIRAGEEP